MRSKYFTYIFALMLLHLLVLPAMVWAEEGADAKKMEAFHTSGLPLPRFVSVEDEKARVRAGPGEKYPIQWVIERKGLPVEIILEFENWRKIRDFEGQEGWVFQALLSGKRTGIVKAAGKQKITVYERPYESITKESRPSLYLESGVIVDIHGCEDNWCRIESSGFSGWLQRKFIWGVYESENFD